ncbi:hypothetical protein [Chromohalobacter israelensis]|uniref:hypothetical protein n=1 Tax=Chromohalobacter israelensis TaxID=141390 RepID=UPI000FFE8778|nr:hypothetical protein [Chromohalobacter salexigens]RXE49198.1 hypothetical protein B4O83_14965 [Chromohalobacter salexigens]
MFLTLLKGAARFLPLWVWVALAALIAGGGGWVWHRLEVAELDASLADAKANARQYASERDQWHDLAKQRQQALGRLRLERRAAETAVRQLQDDLADRNSTYRARQQHIADAPPEDDGPVAPVLREALEALPHAD